MPSVDGVVNAAPQQSMLWLPMLSSVGGPQLQLGRVHGPHEAHEAVSIEWLHNQGPVLEVVLVWCDGCALHAASSMLQDIACCLVTYVPQRNTTWDAS